MPGKAMSHQDFSARRPYNAAVDFVDGNVAHGNGKRVAFKEATRSITYAELQAETCRFGRGLYKLGLKPESRVILLHLDTIDFPIAFWGAIRAGVIPIPLNTLLTPEQYAYIIEDSRAEVIFISPELIPSISPILQKLTWLRLAIVTGDDKKTSNIGKLNVHRSSDVLASGTPEVWNAPTISDEIAFWLYSSGSTGEPKGVRHIQSSLIATAKLFGQDVMGIKPNDVVFSAAKLFFAYGLGNSMSFPMSVGATTILLKDRPTPDLVLEVMKRENPTIFYGVPTLFGALLNHKDIGKGAGSSKLRLCTSAGEALPANLGERWRTITGVDILDGIGSTEMLHIFVSNRPGDICYGTSGRPVPGYDAKIIGEDGKELGDGEIGELVVRGHSSADGYWNQRAKSRRTFVGEWTYTGDKYLRDSKGYYVYCGRTDDMFKVSGIWVSPFEVEAALLAHEAVLEAAVIGKKDNDGLMKPKAYVVLKQGFDGNEKLFEALRTHVKSSAGMWKYPRWIDVRLELPKTATGKIQRFKLRDEDAGKPV